MGQKRKIIVISSEEDEEVLAARNSNVDAELEFSVDEIEDYRFNEHSKQDKHSLGSVKIIETQSWIDKYKPISVVKLESK